MLVPLANPVGEQAVQGGGHDGELEIDVDLERHGGGQGIHVEEVDRLGDGILDQHAAGIAVDQPGRRFVLLVGDQQGGLVVAEIGDGDLADGVGIVLQSGLLVEDARVPVGAPDIAERDPLPGGAGCRGDGSEQLGAGSAEGDEADAELVEAREVGVGGQLGIEDQLAGPGAGALLPVLGEAQDLVVVGVLAERAVGIAEQACLVVAGDAGRVRGALGEGVEAGEQGEAVVEDLGQWPGRACRCPTA